MSTVIEVHGDDEIADLIVRFRATSEGDDVALVVPYNVRLLQTTVNLRLLKQFVQSSGRRTAIVSSDPRTQQLAGAAGFPTYASLQAYGRGIELVHAPGGGHGEPRRASAVGDGAATALAAPPVTTTPVRVTPVPPQPPLRTLSSSSPRHGDTRRPYVFFGIAIGIIGLALLMVVVPTATVTMTLTADPINVTATIQGSADPAVAGRPDSLVTAVVSDDQTVQFQANPTGTQTIASAKASGYVSIASQLPFPSTFTVPKGEEFDTADTPPVKFFAIQDTQVCVPGPGAPCDPANAQQHPDLIPVQDGTAEGKGNVPSGAIRSWPQNPCAQPGQPCAAGDLRVTNTQATTGGSDQKTIVVATAQDVQTMTGQFNQAQTELMAKVQTNLAAKAGTRVVAKDPAGGGVSIGCLVNPPLPKTNDPYKSTAVTVGCHAKETTYYPDDAVKIVTSDLQAKVPGGDQLAPNCHIPPALITQAADDGTAILSATGECFAQPIVDINGLRNQFAGKSPATVAQLTRTRVGPQVVGVMVDERPFGLPWLPFFSSRIDLHENIVPKKPRTP